jgi:hypothetical protein
MRSAEELIFDMEIEKNDSEMTPHSSINDTNL